MMDFKEPYPEDEGSYTDDFGDLMDREYDRKIEGFYE